MKRILLLLAMITCYFGLNAQSFYYKQALEAFDEENVSKAMDYVNKEIKVNPEFAGAYFLRARLFYNEDKNEDALADLNKSVEYAKDDKDQMLKSLRLRSYVLADLKRYDSAVTDITQVISLEPDNSSHYLTRGSFFHRAKKLAEAEQDFNKALEINDGEIVAMGGLAKLYLETERVKDAEKLFTRALKLNSKYGYAWMGRAEANFTLKKYEEAITDIFNYLLLTEDTDGISDFATYGEMSPPLAFAKVNGQINSSENPVFWYVARAGLYQNMSDWKRAMADYDFILKKTGNNDLYCLLNRGTCCFQAGLYNEAIQSYSQLLKINPDFNYAYIVRGDTYRVDGKYAEAEKDYLKALEADPDHVYLYSALGRIREIFNNNEQALKDYDKGISLDSTYLYLYVSRGRLLLKLNETEKAKDDFDYIIKADTSIQERGNLKQYAYFYNGNIEEAIALQQRILEKFPTESNYYDAACLWSLMNDKEKALAAIRASLEKGYNGFAHMETDSDLDNIRNTEEFIAIVNEYRKKFEKSLKEYK